MKRARVSCKEPTPPTESLCLYVCALVFSLVFQCVFVYLCVCVFVCLCDSLVYE
jgi:hypothetical protein